ncbi:MAG: AAA family ATPase [Defluviitaleaceae bacterium]|nr:AAA family ATPase [Defluviitaleaceae bacterium]
MNIANNILKRSLHNVYFFVGTACGGKTTMGRELSKKHGFIYFSDNWNEPNWKEWESIIDEKYQPYSHNRVKKFSNEEYFSRSVEEVLADAKSEKIQAAGMENIAFSLMEIIKLAQKNTVVADIWIEDFDFLLEISERNKIVCLLAPGELIIRDYYQREDHMDFTRAIQSLENSEQKFEVQNELFRIGAKEMAEKAKTYNLFTIMRSDESTVDSTLIQIENHLCLISS